MVTLLTLDLQFTGLELTPGWEPSCSGLCQAVYSYVPAIKQYNSVPAKRQWCSSAGKVTLCLTEN